MQLIWTGAYLGALYSLGAWTVRYWSLITSTFQPASYEEWAQATGFHPTVDVINYLVAGLIAGAILGIIAERMIGFIQRTGGETKATVATSKPEINLILGVATILLALLALAASFLASAQIAALQPPV